MDEQQIRARFEAFSEAWNAHDVESMTGCFVAGGTITHPWGTFAAGREEITALLSGEHSGAMRESRFRFDALHVRPLSEKSVVAECEGMLESVRAPNGAAYELPHRIQAVLVDDGGWRFLSMNPSLARAGR